MAKFTDGLKKVVAAVAPTIGLALPGPLGSVAANILTKALGVGGENATEEQIEAAVLKGDPETVLKIKQADIEFQQFLKTAEIELVSLDNQDRANAREREIHIKDRTPMLIAAAVIIGFFAVIGWILKWGLPSRGDEALLLLLGTLGAGFSAVLSYYFGSSSSSRTKDATIAAAVASK